MRVRALCSPLGVLVLAVLALAGCSGGPDTERPLPLEFQVRSDVPYIRGEIIERTDLKTGAARIRVRTPRGVEARTPEAIVTVLPDAVIRWENGSHGTRDALRVGQVVTVWTTGVELRSLPPHVSANGLILHRPMWR